MNSEVVDIRKWSKENLWLTQAGELVTRPGLRRVLDGVLAPISIIPYIGGFSLPNQATGETWHYLFYTPPGSVTAPVDVRLDILDDTLDVFETLVIATAVLAGPLPVTYATIAGQLMIAAPGMPTLWGMVGSSVQVATSQSSVSGLTTIDVPDGLISRFSNRVVIANGTSLFFSDPFAYATDNGHFGAPRAFLPNSIIDMPGEIFGLHEGAGGMLVVCTTVGTFGIDVAAASSLFVGDSGVDPRILSHTPTISYQSTCVVRGRVYGLTPRGFAPIDVETDSETVLVQPSISRYFAPRIDVDDLRSARMFSGADGPVISLGNSETPNIVANSLRATCFVDLSEGFASWWRCERSDGIGYMDVRGLLNAPDGSQALLTPDGVYLVTGNFDGEIALTSADANQPRGVAMALVDSSPANPRTVRHVHVAAAIGGDTLTYAAVRGSLGTPDPSTVSADPSGITIGTDAWGVATKRYTTSPLQAQSHHFDESTNDVGIEVASDGCATRVSHIVAVDYSDSGTKRPTARGGS